jgi:predicted transcriptional regulator
MLCIEAPCSLTPSQLDVYRSLAELPRTQEQISVDTGRSGNTVRPRLLELERLGLVYRTNKWRRTATGGQARVWAANIHHVEEG